MRRLQTAPLIAFIAALTACGGGNTAPSAEEVALTATSDAASAATQQSLAYTATPVDPFPGEGPWPVDLTTADGVTLAGTLYGDSPIGVVLAPAYPGGQPGWSVFAASASAQGYHVLIFDLRGYGESEGERSSQAAPDDLAAAVAFLREQGADRLVLIGAGLGGMAAIRVAAGDPQIAGLAVISSPRSFEGFEIADSDLSALTLPTLWLAARNDMTQDVEGMNALVPGSDRELWIYEGSSLNGTYIFEGHDAPDLERRLLEFIARVAGNP